MTQARIPIEFSKGEAAPGQHEVNIRYDDVLESADRSVIFKHGAKEIAWLDGLRPDVHGQARPHLDRLVGPPPHERLGPRRRRALFYREGAEPYGMSDTMRWFLGGMMALARELAIFFAPNINSYKRFAARQLGARQRGLGPRQPHDRVPGRRATGRRCTSSAASRVAT